ncbi:PepSY domain-containing protein [Streptomyces sp. NPDC049687]|uniref:PepSY domain-containing protein n=1 Tax=Streptomyces sp. NPDC049687 TaxID=3365596 RepID=UPI00378A03B5
MKRKLVIAAVATSVVIGGGAAAAFADGGTKTGAKEVRVTEAGTGRNAASAQRASAADVVAAALRHTSGTAVGADREDDGADAGRWHVDVVKGDGTEYTVTVSPDSGKVLGVHRDQDDADDVREARADLAALKGTRVDAREAAQAVAAKGMVTGVDLDDEDRAAVWSVDTAQGGEWTVDARTGEVSRDLED